MDDWQCYKCSGAGTLDYQMLVIESLDGDTETRRLSPVALLGDKYIDLNNGKKLHFFFYGIFQARIWLKRKLAGCEE